MTLDTEAAPAANGSRQTSTSAMDSATLARTSSVGKELALDQYDPDSFNILAPVLVVRQEGADVSPLLTESVSIVEIHGPDSGDVYNDFRYANERDGKFALTSLALARIAAAAGVKWIPDMCKILTRERRPDGNVYIAYQAGAGIRTLNGEWHIEIASKEIDTADVAEQMAEVDRRTYDRMRTQDRAPAWVKTLGRDASTAALEKAIEGRVRQQILQLREHLLSHAETKAKSRVIRRILSLRQVYTKAELGRPFVVPRLVYRPDLTNPLELERVQVEGRRAAAELYGDDVSPLSSTRSGPGEVAATAELPPAASGPEPSGVGRAGGDRETAGGGSGKGAAATASGPTPKVASSPPRDDAMRGEAAAPSEPEQPKSDPLIEGGPYAGQRYSEVVQIDPGYLKAIAAEARAKARREVAQAWLDWARPKLG